MTSVEELGRARGVEWAQVKMLDAGDFEVGRLSGASLNRSQRRSRALRSTPMRRAAALLLPPHDSIAW